jgi:hypothetical protein
MDPIRVILTALAAGASSGVLDELKDEAKEKAKVLYGKLRDLVTRRFHEKGTANADAVLDEFAVDPENYRGGLKKKLEAADAGADIALLNAAQALVDLVNQQQSSSKFGGVRITDSEGVIVGDHATQTNTFGAKPRPSTAS